MDEPPSYSDAIASPPPPPQRSPPAQRSAYHPLYREQQASPYYVGDGQPRPPAASAQHSSRFSHALLGRPVGPESGTAGGAVLRTFPTNVWLQEHAPAVWRKVQSQRRAFGTAVVLLYFVVAVLFTYALLGVWMTTAAEDTLTLFKMCTANGVCAGTDENMQVIAKRKNSNAVLDKYSATEGLVITSVALSGFDILVALLLYARVARTRTMFVSSTVSVVFFVSAFACGMSWISELEGWQVRFGFIGLGVGALLGMIAAVMLWFFSAKEYNAVKQAQYESDAHSTMTPLLDREDE